MINTSITIIAQPYFLYLIYVCGSSNLSIHEKSMNHQVLLLYNSEHIQTNEYTYVHM